MLLDQLDDRLRLAVREHERVDDLGLGRLGGAALDHDDRVAAAGDDEVDVARLELLDRGVDDELAVRCDPRGCRRWGRPRGCRRCERSAGAGEREHVGLVDAVAREHRRDDLRVLLVALGEERAKGTVHDAAGEDLFVAQTPLALEEAARDLAGGVGLLRRTRR
jgi:hypothetical protein